MDSIPSTPNTPEQGRSFEAPRTPEQLGPGETSNNEAEQASQPSPEKLGSSGDSSSQNQGQPIVLPQVAQPIIPGQTYSDGQSTQSAPVIADDVDVIEKEWIDRAKQIIKETENDPHLQEMEIDKLHQAYLQKRYGRTLKSPADK